MNGSNVTAAEIEKWLEAQNKRSPWLASTLGTTKATVGRWLKGQEIPEPMQILLRLLIRGELPDGFAAPRDPGILAFTPREWQQFEMLRIREGFEDVKAWIVAKIRAYIAMSTATANTLQLSRVAEDPAEYKAIPKASAKPSAKK